MEKNISDTITRSRYILSVLIVLYHVGWPYPEMIDGLEHSIFLVIKQVAEICTLSFSLISGYLFWENIYNFDDVLRKMKRRVNGLIIPYILWCLLGTIYVILTNGGRNLVEYIKSYDYVRSIIFWGGMPHFWYVFMLIFFSIVAPILYLVYTRKYLSIGCFGLSLFVIVLLRNSLRYSVYTYIAYIWGGFFAIYIRKIDTRQLLRLLFQVPLWLNIILFGVIYGLEWKLETNLLALYNLRLIRSLLFLLIMHKVNFKIKEHMKFSFWIYATHYYLDYIVMKLFASMQMNALCIQFVTFSVVLFISTTSGYLLKRYFNKAYCRLCGGR